MDSSGVAVIRTVPFPHFKQADRQSEKAFEVNYAAQITRYWLVQPAFQYYVDVGGNSQLHNAPVFGFRTKVTF